jgi:hypothetical protein
MDAYIFTKQAEKFKQTLSAYMKAYGNCFLGLERCADGGIHATRDHNKVTSVLRNTKKEKLRRIIQNKRHGMLTSSVVILNDNACPHTAAHTQALFENINWELFDHLPYSADVAPNDYRLFTYLPGQLVGDLSA